MAAKHDTIVSELNIKIDKIISLYKSSQEYNIQLEKQVAAMRSELENAEREKQELREKLKTTRLANAISSGNGNYDAKIRINQLVREIEKCIALLNN